MGYGIINITGGELAYSIPYHSGAGETATFYYTVPNYYPTNDIYVQTALNYYVCGKVGWGDGAAVGIASYVDGGINYDRGTNPGAWPLFISTSRTTQVRLGYYLSGNASGMRASWHITFWGDDGDRSADRDYDIQPDYARVVYDRDTGRVRHAELRATAGLEKDAYADDPIGDARKLGHTGDLAVLEVAPEELGGSDYLEVDVAAGRLIRTPMTARPGPEPSGD